MKMTELKTIPLKDLKISEQNFRKVDKNSQDFKELTASVKASGVIIPLAVRKNGAGYVVMAGKRRYIAATEAGIKEVPCIVHEVKDGESVNITYLENSFRKGFTPIEESLMVTRLLTAHKGDTKKVAAALGQTIQWVATRARIHAGLIMPIKKLAEGKDVKEYKNNSYEADSYTLLQLYTTGHFAEIAKMPETFQEELLDDALYDPEYGPKTIEDLRTWAEERRQSLNGVSWPLDKCLMFPFKLELDDKELIHDGALRECSNCVYNTKSEPLLFETKAKDAGFCQNSFCFNMKRFHSAIQETKTEQAKRSKYPVKLVFDIRDHQVETIAKGAPINVEFKVYEMYPCKKSDEGSYFAVFVSGKKGGFYRGRMEASGKTAVVKPEKVAKPAKERTDKEKKEIRLAQLTAKRQIFINNHICETIEQKQFKDMIEKDHPTVMRLVASFGTRWPVSGERCSANYFNGKLDVASYIIEQVTPAIQNALYYRGTLKDWTKEQFEFVCEIGKVFGYNISELGKAAEKEHPTPKSLK